MIVGGGLLGNDMNINGAIDNFLKKTLWIWLPFAALKRLLRDFFNQQKP